MLARDLPVIAISAATGENIPMLLNRIQHMLDALPPVEEPEELEVTQVAVDAPQDEKAFQVFQLDDDLWQVRGVAIERAAQMTNWDYYEAAMRFQRILRALGISDALTEAGVVDGDTVRIGKVDLVWGYDNAFQE